METIYIGIDWSRDFVDLAIINGDGNLLLGDKILITKMDSKVRFNYRSVSESVSNRCRYRKL
ncbi:hypothetical protein [Leptospira vanthielii]|uniref:Transposase domain protein n=1 Tax=Leptospira vanthielii serovar Holland str. Waz Holland = ATCC 700522 TaxID=1218591 RepID=N1W9D6_9LEPT|nr:hypothetical protein [Leptospira vanthielii]EMY69827.1 hypothetical protein LEP1GSC199_2806 [Leptospira vanthielii serovar Holland str. Waz Holland = ATCC 700522]